MSEKKQNTNKSQQNIQSKNKKQQNNQKSKKLNKPFYYKKKQSLHTKNTTAAKQKPEKKAEPPKPVKIAFLGGLNEVGKNITLFEYKDEIILVDCGLALPDEDMPGIDLVIPDFSYIEKNADKVKGICITHGHEDHIGSLAYLLKKVNIPVYSTRLTNGLIEGKLREHNLLGGAKLNVVKPGDTVKFGEFSVEFIHVNHSIPDAVALAIKCAGGTIVHTGDFKIDTTPIDA